MRESSVNTKKCLIVFGDFLQYPMKSLCLISVTVLQRLIDSFLLVGHRYYWYRYTYTLEYSSRLNFIGSVLDHEIWGISYHSCNYRSKIGIVIVYDKNMWTSKIGGIGQMHDKSAHEMKFYNSP